MAWFLTLLAVLGTTLGANGAPAEAEAAAKSNYCANFDNLPQSATGFDPTTNPVGTYRGISYAGFVVATPQNSNPQYFVPPSKPNVINSGTPARAAYGGTPALRINTTATGGPKDTFTLTSLRLACLVTNGVYVGNVEGCTALFVGNKRSGAPSVIYEYEYPNQDTGSTLTTFGTVNFPNDFTGLSEVFITLTSVQNDVITPNTLLDDVCLSIQG